MLGNVKSELKLEQLIPITSSKLSKISVPGKMVISDFERKITNVIEKNERNQLALDERSNTVANETRKEG